MNFSPVYILIAIVALAAIAVIVFVIMPAGQQRKLSPLAGLSFGLVIAGILFGEERWLGYSLMGIGVLLAVMDIIIKYKAKG